MTRTLILTTPMMTGEDVVLAQRLLKRHGDYGGIIDGEFGELSAQASYRAQYQDRVCAAKAGVRHTTGEAPQGDSAANGRDEKAGRAEEEGAGRADPTAPQGLGRNEEAHRDQRGSAGVEQDTCWRVVRRPGRVVRHGRDDGLREGRLDRLRQRLALGLRPVRCGVSAPWSAWPDGHDRSEAGRPRLLRPGRLEFRHAARTTSACTRSGRGQTSSRRSRATTTTAASACNAR